MEPEILFRDFLNSRRLPARSVSLCRDYLSWLEKQPSKAYWKEYWGRAGDLDALAVEKVLSSVYSDADLVVALYQWLETLTLVLNCPASVRVLFEKVFAVRLLAAKLPFWGGLPSVRGVFLPRWLDEPPNHEFVAPVCALLVPSDSVVPESSSVFAVNFLPSDRCLGAMRSARREMLECLGDPRRFRHRPFPLPAQQQRLDRVKAVARHAISRSGDAARYASGALGELFNLYPRAAWTRLRLSVYGERPAAFLSRCSVGFLLPGLSVPCGSERVTSEIEGGSGFLAFWMALLQTLPRRQPGGLPTEISAPSRATYPTLLALLSDALVQGGHRMIFSACPRDADTGRLGQIDRVFEKLQATDAHAGQLPATERPVKVFFPEQDE